MQIKMKVRWVFTVLLLCLLFACTTPGGRTTGEVIDDASITTAVKTRIFEDPLLSGFAISVKTFQGQVTLTGAVKTAYAKNRATELAWGVNGVHRVNNLLNIR
jgi:hyperosmotically inducible periplasmic protein